MDKILLDKIIEYEKKLQFESLRRTATYLINLTDRDMTEVEENTYNQILYELERIYNYSPELKQYLRDTHSSMKSVFNDFDEQAKKND